MAINKQEFKEVCKDLGVRRYIFSLCGNGAVIFSPSGARIFNFNGIENKNSLEELLTVLIFS